MAPKPPCAKYQYVVTPAGPKILPVEEPSCKDEESPADYNAGGYLPVKVNDTFKHGRYRVVRKLGWGHFSTVWLVKDSQTTRHSALKVVKSAGRYAETARDEIKLLSQVSSVSPTHPGRSHIVSFLDSFSHQGPEASHVCIVFEPLGENLLALIERHKKKGVPRPLVKVIARQILQGLQYLHDECDLVHTDIKPENILISIPDIEAHIHNELSQSPTPTSRRVGVPLPTKSRAGVSIPHNQLRTRRQVQIFDSQPLASPGKSAGPSAHGHASMSMSMSARQGGSGSGSNSMAGSYTQQFNMSKLSAAGASSLNYASGTATSLSSSAPKIPSGLSSSAPRFESSMLSKSDPHINSTANILASSATLNFTSPSTSSSSSSISSALASTTAGSSSIVSTPPTSLSHSLGHVVAGFMGLGRGIDDSKLRLKSESSDQSRSEGQQDRVGLPMINKKGKEKTTDGAPSSWKDHMGLSTSWKEKISASISSSFKSSSNSSRSNPKSGHARRPTEGHARSQSGSGFWKDPGAAAPAPAVVVSAVVCAGGEEGETYFQLAGASSSTATSESSSATATIARPSPTSTPHPVLTTKAQSSSILNGINGLITDTSNMVLVDSSANDLASSMESCGSDPTPHPATSHPSLLTQTAPHRAPLPIHSSSTSNSKRTNPRASPPQQVSQLSAHMLTHPSSDKARVAGTSPLPKTTKTNIITNSAHHRRASTTAPISPTSVTPTPTSPSPVAPPPTPITSPTIPAMSPPTVATSMSPRMGVAMPPPILTPPSAVHRPPPISIKIADLGNATPSTKHYTEDIQTRQYRAPEAILGKRDWDARADIWSVACLVFELLTAEYLFDPQGQGELFTKDDDHMAQIIELLGDFPVEIKMGGKYSRELFDHTGALRYIRTLKPWPLKRVMTEKYLFTDADATAFCEFLEPMLVVDMRKRSHARDMLDHSWLQPTEADGVVDEW